MTWLIGLIVGVVLKVLTWLFTTSANKAITIASLVAGFGLLLSGLLAVCNAAIDMLIYSLPQYFAVGMALVVPSNLSFCVSAIIMVQLARYTFAYYKVIMVVAASKTGTTGG